MHIFKTSFMADKFVTDILAVSDRNPIYQYRKTFWTSCDTQQCGFDFIQIWYQNRIFFSSNCEIVPRSYWSIQMYVIFWYSRCGFDCFFFFFIDLHCTIFFSCHGLIYFFSSPCQRQCELLPSLGVRRLSSVNFSHFNLLFWNRKANWSEIW